MRKFSVFACAALIGCAGATPDSTLPIATGSAGTTTAAKPSGPGDDVLDIEPAVKINGIDFEPNALGFPGMPLAEPKGQKVALTGKKMDDQIKKERAALASTKDLVTKQAHAALLATMLYHKSKDVTGDEQKQVLADARQTLRDAVQNSGAEVDELTIRMLGSYELLFEDYPAAEKVWGQLVTKLPKDKDAPFNRAWWGLALLRQHKNAEALEVVKSEQASEKQPELAYVIAWAKWRTGDDKGAFNAILSASRGWGSSANRDQLDRDVLLIGGRAGISFDEALKQLAPVFGKAKENQYALLVRLGRESYFSAGRWADSIAALEKALDTMGDKTPPNDRPTIRYLEAEFNVPLDKPTEAAKYALAALDALAACGAKCPAKDQESIVQSVYLIGYLFHALYASAHDDRYYQPAHDLYAKAIPLMTTASQADKDKAVKASNELEKSFKSMKAGVGKHDAAYLGAYLHHHDREVQACYEVRLSANPNLSGTLTVNLESDETGVIKGVATDPKGGLADMAAVATCVGERAKAWKLPTKARKGSTRIKLTYALAKAPLK